MSAHDLARRLRAQATDHTRTTPAILLEAAEHLEALSREPDAEARELLRLERLRTEGLRVELRQERSSFAAAQARADAAERRASDLMGERHADLGRLMEAVGVHNDGRSSPAELFERCLARVRTMSWWAA